MLSLAQQALTVLSGSAVGFTLGLVGGGGSIIAVPLLVHVVAMKNPHVAIGTSAAAVAASAFLNALGHVLKKTISWPCALVFGIAGVPGALAGASIGKEIDAQILLIMLSALMLVVAFRMLLGRTAVSETSFTFTRKSIPKLLGVGLCTGALAGLLGIGGGFLIVPGLLMATKMPPYRAIGSSLIIITVLGVTTTITYAVSQLVDWLSFGMFLAGSAAGGLVGGSLAARLASHSRMLNSALGTAIFLVAAYTLFRAINP